MRFFFQRHCFWQDHHKPRMFTIRIEIQAPAMRLHDSPSKYSAQPSSLPHHFCRKEWLSHFVSDFLRYPSSAVRNGNLHVFANIFHLQFPTFPAMVAPHPPHCSAGSRAPAKSPSVCNGFTVISPPVPLAIPLSISDAPLRKPPTEKRPWIFSRATASTPSSPTSACLA